MRAIDWQIVTQMQAILVTVDEHAEATVVHPAVRVKTHRGAEIQRTVADETAEPETVIEIPVARGRNRERQ